MLEWLIQNPNINPLESLWQDMKIGVHRESPYNLTELELFWKEECAKISVIRCAKLVETYTQRLTAEIAVKMWSTKY